MQKVKILKRKDGSFTGDNGEQVEYYWYKGIRLADEVTIEFGSRNGDHEEGSEVAIDLEKYESNSGKIKYKERI